MRSACWLLVLVDRARTASGSSRPRRSMTSRDKHVAHQRRELRLEPRTHRRAEAALLAVQDRFGQHALQRCFMTCFKPPPRILSVPGMRAASSTRR